MSFDRNDTNPKPSTLFNEGYRYFEKNEYQQAMELFEKALKLFTENQSNQDITNPDRIRCHFYLGYIYYLRNDQEQAAKHLYIAASHNLDPEINIQALNYLAEIEMKLVKSGQNETVYTPEGNVKATYTSTLQKYLAAYTALKKINCPILKPEFSLQLIMNIAQCYLQLASGTEITLTATERLQYLDNACEILIMTDDNLNKTNIMQNNQESKMTSTSVTVFPYIQGMLKYRITNALEKRAAILIEEQLDEIKFKRFNSQDVKNYTCKESENDKKLAREYHKQAYAIVKEYPDKFPQHDKLAIKQGTALALFAEKEYKTAASYLEEAEKIADMDKRMLDYAICRAYRICCLSHLKEDYISLLNDKKATQQIRESHTANHYYLSVINKHLLLDSNTKTESNSQLILKSQSSSTELKHNETIHVLETKEMAEHKRYETARALYILDRHQEAEKIFKSLIETNYNNADIINSHGYLAAIYFNMQNPKLWQTITEYFTKFLSHSSEKNIDTNLITMAYQYLAMIEYSRALSEKTLNEKSKQDQINSLESAAKKFEKAFNNDINNVITLGVPFEMYIAMIQICVTCYIKSIHNKALPIDTAISRISFAIKLIDFWDDKVSLIKENEEKHSKINKPIYLTIKSRFASLLESATSIFNQLDNHKNIKQLNDAISESKHLSENKHSTDTCLKDFTNLTTEAKENAKYRRYVYDLYPSYFNYLKDALDIKKLLEKTDWKQDFDNLYQYTSKEFKDFYQDFYFPNPKRDKLTSDDLKLLFQKEYLNKIITENLLEHAQGTYNKPGESKHSILFARVPLFDLYRSPETLKSIYEHLSGKESKIAPDELACLLDQPEKMSKDFNINSDKIWPRIMQRGNLAVIKRLLNTIDTKELDTFEFLKDSYPAIVGSQLCKDVISYLISIECDETRIEDFLSNVSQSGDIITFKFIFELMKIRRQKLSSDETGSTEGDQYPLGITYKLAEMGNYKLLKQFHEYLDEEGNEEPLLLHLNYLGHYYPYQIENDVDFTGLSLHPSITTDDDGGLTYMSPAYVLIGHIRNDSDAEELLTDLQNSAFFMIDWNINDNTNENDNDLINKCNAFHMICLNRHLSSTTRQKYIVAFLEMADKDNKVNSIHPIGRELLCQANAHGYTPFYYALMCNPQLDFCQYLLKQGVDLEKEIKQIPNQSIDENSASHRVLAQLAKDKQLKDSSWSGLIKTTSKKETQEKSNLVSTSQITDMGATKDQQTWISSQLLLNQRSAKENLQDAKLNGESGDYKPVFKS